MYLTQIQKTKTIKFKFWKALFLSSQRYHPPEKNIVSTTNIITNTINL